jgi:hypothetical protein
VSPEEIDADIRKMITELREQIEVFKVTWPDVVSDLKAVVAMEEERLMTRAIERANKARKENQPHA